MFCIKQYFYIIVFSIFISFIASLITSSSYNFDKIIPQLRNKNIKIAVLMGAIGFIIHLTLRNTLIQPDCIKKEKAKQ